ncbi:GAF domain-containing protein [Streptomyces sp. DSM 118148]|uniref:GAF domain-containing protein n=1 Tax=Streptomyces sp. DSM 118148 TaxID=3448667 RepID=UPI004040348C
MRHLLLPPQDPEAAARSRRLRELGIEDRPDPELDAFARQLARRTGGCYAGVNFFLDENRQYFAGLYSAASDTTVELETPLLEEPVPGRVMPRDLDIGFCPHVVRRRKALVLDDVRDFPRFAGNHVVDAIGIHSYLGAPLIDRTGVVLGTICVVDQDPHAWGQEGLETIKSMAAELVERIEGAGRRG